MKNEFKKELKLDKIMLYVYTRLFQEFYKIFLLLQYAEYHLFA